MLARVEIDGVENVPNAGPLILAGNHISLFDFLIFGSVLGGGRNRLPVTPSFIIADKWKRRINAYAAQLGNPIYIRRGQGDMDALSGALDVLAAKGAVAIMPEGRPTRGALTKAKPGVAYLASQHNAPVVPIAVYGHDRVLKYWPRMRRVPVKIRIGEPFHLAAENGKAHGDYQHKADLVMTHIARLMPPDYHGVYGTAANGKQVTTASTLLSLCELFSDADPAILNELASELQVITLERGETLMRQGDPADCMYAIVSGRLQLFTESGDGTQRLLAELRSGETVGEVDLIDGRPRMATARAVRDSELVRVSRLGFERLVGGNADSLNKVANILAGRMRALRIASIRCPSSRPSPFLAPVDRPLHLRSAPSCAKRSARSGRFFT